MVQFGTGQGAGVSKLSGALVDECDKVIVSDA